jgi:hypothetical protein
MAEPDGTHDFTLDWRAAVPQRIRILAPGWRSASETRWRTCAMVPAEGRIPRDHRRPEPAAPARDAHGLRVARDHAPAARGSPAHGVGLIDVRGVRAHLARMAQLDRAVLLGGRDQLCSPSRPPTSRLTGCRQLRPPAPAGHLVSLHVPGRLDPAGIRGLARHVADEARAVGHDGSPRHLLLAGPVSSGCSSARPGTPTGRSSCCGTAARTRSPITVGPERYRRGRVAIMAHR